MLVLHQGKIWIATKVKGGYKLHSPLPQSLATVETIDRYVKGIAGKG